MTAIETSSQTVAAVERAADVLLHFAKAPGRDLGVTDIADALALPKAAVHRVLASLRTRGLVHLDEESHRYSLGPSALQLGVAFLDKVDVRESSRPLLRRLTQQTRETTTLSVPAGARSRIYVDQVLPDREVVMSVSLGEPYPLHAGASSRALLAFRPQEEIDSYLAEGELTALTSATLVDPDVLRDDLARIRERGWAESVAERKEGAASVAAPVLDHDGHAIAVMSVCGPTERFSRNRDEVRSALLAVTDELSRRSGWSAG